LEASPIDLIATQEGHGQDSQRFCCAFRRSQS